MVEPRGIEPLTNTLPLLFYRAKMLKKREQMLEQMGNLHLK